VSACPALFDLGEGAKVVMLSVTEGDDKPLKYPHMFRAADIVIITKSDLLPHVDFSIDRCLGNMRAVNRSIRSFVLSAITGEGVGAWHDWLKAVGSAAVQASV
jgi:hydrogenase nickel incorporation protein HypB